MNELVAIVRRCQAATLLEDRERFAEELFDEIGPLVHAFVLRHVHANEAEDVSQVTLLAISRNLQQFHSETDGELWSWCYTIARHKISEHWRRKKTKPQPVLDEDDIRRAVEASPKKEPLSEGEGLDLEYAMGLLRQAKLPCCYYLQQYYLFEWTYAEIGLAWGQSKDAARVQIDRCLALVQSLMEGEA